MCKAKSTIFYRNTETDNKLEITQGTIEDIDEIYPNFSKEFSSENHDKKYLLELMEKGKYLLLLAKEKETNLLIGYAFLFRDNEQKFLWLDYVSILPEYRKNGYGKCFMQNIINMYKSEDIGIFLEIDYNFKDPYKLIEVEKRIQFYQKFGAKKLNVKYSFPESDGTESKMDLYFIPININYILPKNTVKENINSLFEYFYDEDFMKQHHFVVFDNIQDTYF